MLRCWCARMTPAVMSGPTGTARSWWWPRISGRTRSRRSRSSGSSCASTARINPRARPRPTRVQRIRTPFAQVLTYSTIGFTVGGNPAGGPMPRRLRAALATGLAITVGTALAATAAARPAIAENNGLAVAAPPMGWSGYSFLRNDPTAAGMEAQADAMKSSGLSSHGYSYINLDYRWEACNANGPEVDANGRGIANPTEFPAGIAAVASHVHADGLKFGIYVTPGIPKNAVLANTPILGTSSTASQIAETSVAETNYDCGHMDGINYSAPGAQAYINSWANEFASWGWTTSRSTVSGHGTSPMSRPGRRRCGRPAARSIWSSPTPWPSLTRPPGRRWPTAGAPPATSSATAAKRAAAVTHSPTGPMSSAGSPRPQAGSHTAVLAGGMTMTRLKSVTGATTVDRKSTRLNSSHL